MAEHSAIEWTDHTWSPWIGCTKVSPACDGCYAEHLMDTRMGRVAWGPHGERSRTSAGYWRKPLAWDREAKAAGKALSVFPSLCDPFDNRANPAVRREWFDLIRATPNLTWLLLTKRPQNAIEMSEAAGGLPENAALGTTCEDQKRADINVPHLLRAKGILRPAFTFLSCEPLLGPISLEPWLPWPDASAEVGGVAWGCQGCDGDRGCDCPENKAVHFEDVGPTGPDGAPEWITVDRLMLDWVITGGETDQGQHRARPTNPQWFRDIRDQCAAGDVPYLHKQNGEWVSVSEVEGPGEIHTFADGRNVRRIGKRKAGRTIDGFAHDGFPLSPSSGPIPHGKRDGGGL